ncbi:MAG TPA: hypothetical protein PK165_04455 [bacterium]|nr:hypothetical protein [bacterium]HOL49979.1 hypothetical protein [bacterium]HPO52065.1 hypothetical protein [bacterium]HXK45075.1 hypothetical protein [bacterium]
MKSTQTSNLYKILFSFRSLSFQKSPLIPLLQRVKTEEGTRGAGGDFLKFPCNFRSPSFTKGRLGWISEIPLCPPFTKGENVDPLFIKEGLGEISKSPSIPLL